MRGAVAKRLRAGARELSLPSILETKGWGQAVYKGYRRIFKDMKSIYKNKGGK